eukprot:42852-Prorocentrum_minimum.AAC.1
MRICPRSITNLPPAEPGRSIPVPCPCHPVGRVGCGETLRWAARVETFSLVIEQAYSHSRRSHW